MNTWRYFILRKNKRLSYEEKLKICELYDKGEGTHRGLAKQFGIDKTTIQQLYFKYKNFGAETLHMKGTHQSYTETFKHIVIASYKNGEGSYYDLAIKYGIDNPSLIARWVLGYNNSKTTHSGSGGINIMAKKTTLEERIKIVEYLIKHELDYHGTAVKFNVSYQQIYTWYKKYQSLGVNGLNDNRGRRKQTEELSELEQLRRENERLKQALYLSEAAKEVFKKKRDLEEKVRLTSLGTKPRTKQ